MNSEENLLEHILGFVSIAKDLERSRENLAEIAMKEQRETVGTALADATHQQFVRETVAMLVLQHGHAEL
jgi:hypothetical protein